ncbi:MAG: peptide chain release factor N(5)-glutamine methyltransferase [Candidatus Binatia bacterium]
MDAAALLARAAARLAAAGIDSARLDAEVLLAHALAVGRTALYARLRDPVPEAAAASFAALLERRVRREPVAYLTGTREFWSLSFAVSPAVLIPRPETELLVELATRGARAPAAAAGAPPPGAPAPDTAGRAVGTILDLGTGSGCIAVAIAHELAHARVVAVESSADALELARRNAAAHGVAHRIAFRAGDLFAAVSPGELFDCIVSNPPYLAPGDAASPELAFEPRVALDGGADGLAVVRRIIAAAPQHLRAGGRLLIELGAGQDAPARALALAAGLRRARVETDLAGIPRVLVAERG